MKKETISDRAFILEISMRKSIERTLNELQIKNARMIALILMGVILPYMVAFAYHDNDNQRTGESTNEHP